MAAAAFERIERTCLQENGGQRPASLLTAVMSDTNVACVISTVTAGVWRRTGVRRLAPLGCFPSNCCLMAFSSTDTIKIGSGRFA